MKNITIGRTKRIIKKENPHLKITEVVTLNAKNWNKLDEEKKKPFYNLVAKDRLRFDKETKELAELGYFTNADGIKSTNPFLNKNGK